MYAVQGFLFKHFPVIKIAVTPVFAGLFDRPVLFDVARRKRKTIKLLLHNDQPAKMMTSATKIIDNVIVGAVISKEKKQER